MPQNKRKKLFLSRVPVAINQHAPVYIDRKNRLNMPVARKQVVNKISKAHEAKRRNLRMAKIINTTPHPSQDGERRQCLYH